MFPQTSRQTRPVPASFVLLAAAILSLAGAPACAQNSDVNLALHANSHASASEIGLPYYPGAAPYKENADSDSTANLGFTFGDFHFSVMAAEYTTPDSPQQVLAFYRKPLSHYGQVLECDHGKPVGTLTVTNSGLTCSGEHDGHMQINGSANSSSDIELRAGSPHRFRIVGINNDTKSGSTHFGLVYLELPRDTGGSKETK